MKMKSIGSRCGLQWHVHFRVHEGAGPLRFASLRASSRYAVHDRLQVDTLLIATPASGSFAAAPSQNVLLQSCVAGTRLPFVALV